MDAIETEPTMRCQQIKNRIQSIGVVFGENIQKKIVSRISKATLQAIDLAEDDQWLPVSINVEITDCIAAEVGEEGVYNLSLKSFNKILESSTIGQLFRSTLHFLKIKPTTVIKLTPKFWREVYRDCGEMSVVEKGPNQVLILLNNLPPFIAKNRNYLMTVAGGIHSVLAFGGVSPKVILEKHSEETREASFVASWVPNK